MHFYRYFDITYGYKTLEDSRLMLARPSMLNDPFEFVYRNSGTMTLSKARQYIKKQKKSQDFYDGFRKSHPNIRNKKAYKVFLQEKLESLAKTYHESFPEITEVDPAFCHKLADEAFRIACFSSTEVSPHEEILMWSHYAVKHTGIRVKFSLNENKKHPYFMKKIEYSKERVGIDLTESSSEEAVRAAIIRSISTKAECWAYEKEFRLITVPRFCREEVCIDGVARSFKEFNPAIVIGVDLGLKCSPEDGLKVKSLVRSKYQSAEVRRAYYHKSQFALEYKPEK